MQRGGGSAEQGDGDRREKSARLIAKAFGVTGRPV